MLGDIKRAVDTAKMQGLSSLTVDPVTDFERRYTAILDTGLAINPLTSPVEERRGRAKQSPPRNLLDRLIIHRSKVLAFLHDFAVPFDNNQAERDIRMTPDSTKSIGRLSHPSGASVFGQVRGYLSIASQNSQHVLGVLYQAFIGAPYILPHMSG